MIFSEYILIFMQNFRLKSTQTIIRIIWIDNTWNVAHNSRCRRRKVINDYILMPYIILWHWLGCSELFNVHSHLSFFIFESFSETLFIIIVYCLHILIIPLLKCFIFPYGEFKMWFFVFLIPFLHGNHCTNI